jgi:hypothetical protein
VDRVRSKVSRVALLALIGLASLNLWTSGPLLALWVASRTQESGPPTMTGLFVVTAVLLPRAFTPSSLVRWPRMAATRTTTGRGIFPTTFTWIARARQICGQLIEQLDAHG